MLNAAISEDPGADRGDARPAERRGGRGPWASGFDIQGHRGARGHRPESTWAGIAYAVDLGATTVELDLRLTADGDAVVWHDPTLTRADPDLPEAVRGAWIADLPTAVVTSARLGARPDPAWPQQVAVDPEGILTLREVLTRAQTALPTTWFNLELKVDHDTPEAPVLVGPLVAAVTDDLRATGMGERAIIHSFDWSVLLEAGAAAPEVARSALLEPATTRPGSRWLAGLDPVARASWSHAAEAARAVGAQVLCPRAAWEWHAGESALWGPSGTVDAELVRQAQEAGLVVVPWTVNDPIAIGELVAAGVDGIVTDYPERVAAVLRDAW